MARKFLYLVAGLIVLGLVALIVLRVWSQELTELAFVPTTEFEEQEPLSDNVYAASDMWFVRPGKGEILARWQPEFVSAEGEEAEEAETSEDTPASPERQVADGGYVVFFVHPTSYLDRSHWNAPLADSESQRVARIFVRGLASPFGNAEEIWVPRYRQATFGAFLTDSEEAGMALDAAYQDVAAAFRYFLAETDPDLPIVLAGHSQGALHLISLLQQEIAGTPAAERIAAIYPVGWPISLERDLAALPFPQCETREQASCIASWSSFGEPADPDALLETYSASTGFDGEPRGETAILCTNPITGAAGGEAPASANPGTLVPDEDMSSGSLQAGYVGARCDERGLLLIGEPPEMGSAVLPGNNYHVYDIPLFWSSLKADVAARVAAWRAAP